MTILFAEDWAKYPNAIIDTQTKNKSFVRLASVYRSMGVRNHAFILALINPKLQGVDPHDPELSQQTKLMIATECKLNYWYYLREVIRVPAIGSSEGTYFEANRGNIASAWLFFNHITYTLIQPRQTGKSFSTDTLMVYLMDIGCLNTKINLLTKDDNLRRANILRLKDIRSELPPYLRQFTPKDANNTEEMTTERLGNRYTTHVPRTSPKDAIKLGRGLTTSIFHIDELPFIPHISIALPAALAAMGAAVDKSKAEGAHYGTILTTTAGKKDDRDGRYAYGLVSESAIWDEKFFDCRNLEHLENVIKNNSRNRVLRVNLTFNHRQLGKTDEWLLRKLQDSTQSGDDANRDFFNLWTSGSQSHPLPVHILEKITSSVRDVEYTEISGQNGYVIRWYIPENDIPARMASSKYIMGMDTSEACGNDDISMVIMDVETLEVIACGTFNETNLIHFAMWIVSLMFRFVNLTAIIENRSTGTMLIDYLLVELPKLGIDPFKRLFNTCVQNADEQPERFSEIRQPMSRRNFNTLVKYKKTFGYSTSGSGAMSRTQLYSTSLNIAAKSAADRVHDKSIIDQIAGLITKNGRIDHQDGEHDDMVVGWLLCIWMITQGKNLSHYGIDSKTILSRTNINEPYDAEAERFKALQAEYRNRLEEVSTLMSKCRDDFLILKYEQEMRSLSNLIVREEGELISVDEMIRRAKEKRRENRGSRVDSWNQNIQSMQSHGVFIHR